METVIVTLFLLLIAVSILTYCVGRHERLHRQQDEH